MLRKLLLAVATAFALLVAPALVSAHVHIDPLQAPKGGFAKLTFHVPNERDSASTTKVDIKLPTDHPLAAVTVEPKPGWTVQVRKTHLPQPIATPDGPVSDTTSEVTWSGGKIGPGQFDEFSLAAAQLPSDVDQLAFPAVQTYSNGEEVAWVDPTPPNGPEPSHPAPLLKLVNADQLARSVGGGSTPTPEERSAALPEGVATKGDVRTVRMIAVVGGVLGLIGVLVAGTAFARLRRSP
jgi:uncharacterized protein YcnI